MMLFLRTAFLPCREDRPQSKSVPPPVKEFRVRTQREEMDARKIATVFITPDVTPDMNVVELAGTCHPTFLKIMVAIAQGLAIWFDPLICLRTSFIYILNSLV